MTRFIFITGGVVSSLGKGLTTAALGALLQARGYKVRLRKLDPYLNVDPGTMSPFEHGELFVTDDGAETVLDLGHYERFTGVAAKKTDSISSGKIYSNVLDKERKGDYLGKTIQVIPHVTDEIKKFIEIGEKEVDFMLCEIGGTVGDIEGLPFFEAIRQFSQEKGVGSCIFMHLTLVPYIQTSGELKTKPTQHSVKELRSIGLSPDILVCRAKDRIPNEEKKKLALFCNVKPEAIISAYDLNSIYDAPLAFHKECLDIEVKDEGSDLSKGLFYMESQLEDFIIQNWNESEFGKKYDLIIKDGELESQQYRTDIGPIDILATDKNTGEYVVIELKRNQTSDQTIGQIARYMQWVEENLNKGVKGVIVCGKWDEKLDYARKRMGDVEVLLYEVNFSLKEYKK